MEKRKCLTNKLKVIVVNPPSEKEMERKIQIISEILSKKGDCK